MIGYLKGFIQYRGKGYIVINVNNIGYKVEVTEKLLDLSYQSSEIELYIYPESSERGSRLFGFLDEKSLNIFELLLTVNGIGPKGALNILSNSNVDELSSAIDRADVKFLSSIPSLGKRMAERMILDLKGKIDFSENYGIWSSVRSALVNLNYSNVEIDSIREEFKEKYEDIDDTSEAIRMSILLLNDSKKYE
jgi:Holliday junction DNA helicase RuvA